MDKLDLIRILNLAFVDRLLVNPFPVPVMVQGFMLFPSHPSIFFSGNDSQLGLGEGCSIIQEELLLWQVELATQKEAQLCPRSRESLSNSTKEANL